MIEWVPREKWSAVGLEGVGLFTDESWEEEDRAEDLEDKRFEDDGNPIDYEDDYEEF